MSTICKLNPKVREDRGMRRALLHNAQMPTISFEGQLMWTAIMSKLQRTYKNPALTGAVKQELFNRGVRQITVLV